MASVFITVTKFFKAPINTEKIVAYCTAVIINEPQYTSTWMNLKNILLKENRHIRVYYVISHT